MNAIRKNLMPLLIIPFGMFIYVFIHPDWQWESPGLEYLFALIGLPILIINFIAWLYPEMIEAYFPVKDDSGQGRGKPITFAMLVSALIALTCVGVGGMTAAANARPRPTVESSGVQPLTATAFARSIQLLASATDSGLSAIVSTPRPSLEPDIAPDETPQIPVSGGVPTSSPASSVMQAEAASAFSGPTSTADPPGSCTPADPEYIDAIWQAVQDADPDSDVVTGWMVQSNAAADLWFVAAKIYNSETETEATLPGVWALLVDAEGSLEIYSINDIAMESSDAARGEDREPVLTMQSDGAQIAYDCAARAE